MKFYLTITLLITRILLPEAKANDCKSLTNPEQKLVCQTEPALLEVLNPGLKIPLCNSHEALPKVLPANLPLSAIFVSCEPSTRDSCKNIAKSVLQNGGGATVNVIISRTQMQNIEPEINEIISAAKTSMGKLNIIPVDSKTPAYMRDPGLFRFKAKKNEFISNPYNNQGILGSEIMNEVMTKCRLGFSTAYKKLAKFNSTFTLLQNDPIQAYKNFGFDDVYAKRLSEQVTDDRGREISSIQQIWGPTLRTDGSRTLMGGNFMALPGNTLIVGTNNHSQPDPEILNFFSKNQKVKVIQLPELTIGHVDEVFNIVPAKNQCGFKLLRASPLEMKKFLSTRPPSESLGNPSDEFDAVREADNPIHKQYLIEFQKVQRIFAQNGTLTFEEKSELDTFRLKWLKNTRKEQAAQDILLNQELMSVWDKRQVAIDNATSEIIAEIKKTTGKDCQDEVVDIPVFWTATGTPVIANPVNGLTVNGNYFYSKGAIRKMQPLQYNTNGISDLEVSEDYIAYNNYVQQKLRPIFADKMNAIDLKQYDDGNGNFHCATTNIFVPCK